jgi:predicted GH43/DUF377 family glycosyl hydrolase
MIRGQHPTYCGDEVNTGSNPVLTTSDWLLLYNEHRRRKEVEFSQVAELVDANRVCNWI